MITPDVKQQLIIDKFSQHKNVFITGPGGTGKTELIKHIRQLAVDRGVWINVCALTGCAAMLLECNAKTVHSWAGIGIGHGTIADNVLKIKRSRFKTQNWRQTDILVIDEVSMMSVRLFDMLDAIGKATRKNQLPFGGIQLIFSGDFFQLPPVGDRDDRDSCRFCFESDQWPIAFAKEDHVQLTHNFRQDNIEYVRILNEIRRGRVRRASINLIEQQLNRAIPIDCVITPTKLFPTRRQVDEINVGEFNKLSGNIHEFVVREIYDGPMTVKEKSIRQQFTPEQVTAELNYIKNSIICDTLLKLKIGSQVMCIANIRDDNPEKNLCNGSQGVVVGIQQYTGYPVVRYTNHFERIMIPYVWASETIPGLGISQIPLIHAWALTIHKSQGATMAYAEIDVGVNVFECGQTYVALSRITRIEGLFISAFDITRVRASPIVQNFYDMLDREEAERDSNQSQEELELENPEILEPGEDNMGDVNAVCIGIPVANVISTTVDNDLSVEDNSTTRTIAIAAPIVQRGSNINVFNEYRYQR